MIKSEMSNEESIIFFIKLLFNQLKLTISKSQLEIRTVFIMDNARIHKTEKIIKLIKEFKMVVFTIPPYSPELNRIEHTFGRLKNRISFKNLNSKDLKHVIMEEVKNL